MRITSLGDLAQSFGMQSRNATIKTEIERLTQELSSGKVADKSNLVVGNSAYLSDLERSLTKLDGFDIATREASQFAAGAQAALSRISENVISFRSTLLNGTASGLSQASNSILSEAKNTFESIVAALNGSASGRSLFAGNTTDASALAEPQDLLTQVSTVMAGAPTVDDMLLAAETWFNDPAGFGATGYLGAQTSLAPMVLSDGAKADFNLRADDQVFRDILRSVAVIALANDPALGLTDAQQGELVQKATGGVVGTSDAVIGFQGKIGFSESQIETIMVRHSAERTSLEMARNDLLSIDPYKSATELEQVQFQLQSLYAITSRMSQLSLVNYI